MHAITKQQLRHPENTPYKRSWQCRVDFSCQTRLKSAVRYVLPTVSHPATGTFIQAIRSQVGSEANAGSFSAGALKLLPERGEGSRAKSKRADRIPDQYVPSSPFLLPPFASIETIPSGHTDQTEQTSPSSPIITPSTTPPFGSAYQRKSLHPSRLRQKYGLPTSGHSSRICPWASCCQQLPRACCLARGTRRLGGLRWRMLLCEYAMTIHYLDV